MPTNTKVQDFKKSLIVETAQRLFRENPYETVTIEQIAKSAGFGKSTLYLFFESKEEILETVIKLGLETLSDDFQKISEADISTVEAINLLIPLQYKYFLEYNSLIFTYFQKGNAAANTKDWQADLTHISAQKSAHLAHLLQRGIQEGVFVPSDPEYLAWFVNSLIKGVCMPSLSRKSEMRDQEKDIGMLQTVLLRGIMLNN